MIDKRIKLMPGASDSSRIPNWTTSARVNINGSFFCIVRNPGRYYEIRRNWKDKDSVKIVFDMPVRVVHANPHVRENDGHPLLCVGQSWIFGNGSLDSVDHKRV